MKKITFLFQSRQLSRILILALVSAFVLSSCKKKDDEPEPDPDPVETTITVTGNITTNTTWTAINKYVLSGFVYVKDGATLTIEPGTVIFGEKDTKGTLIIERGGKIMAQGTAAKPIVFTSKMAPGSRNYGDWGGIVICGKAAINVTGGEAEIEGGVGSIYGGGANPVDNDNSGVLSYVRIEFAGIPFVQDKEINGLTCGGVGSGTTIDHIQVSYCGDDSYEWFGGKVNSKYLISYKAWDDDFDTDYGFQGMIQFGVVLRDANIADVSGSNGFESDNDASGSANLPQTKPVFSNISIFGPKTESSTTVNSNYKRAMHLRRNTATSVFNSIFTGYPTGLFIDGTASQTNATNDLLRIENCRLAGMSTFFASQFERDYFKTPSRNNDTLATQNLLMVTAPYAATPNFLPQTGSPLLSGASFTNSLLQNTFFTTTTYIGAMGTTDWTQGWANWDPQNTVY